MTWDKLFSARWFASWLQGVGCFPVSTDRPDFSATRQAIRYLRSGKIVGFFPEGGIRSGSGSILEEAPLRKSTAALADLGHCPVRVCLILGSDRLYDWKQWFRRPEIVLLCGEEFSLDPKLEKKAARQILTQNVQKQFRLLYKKAFSELGLSEEMVPQTAQERMQKTVTSKKVNLV